MERVRQLLSFANIEHFLKKMTVWEIDSCFHLLAIDIYDSFKTSVWNCIRQLVYFEY